MDTQPFDVNPSVCDGPLKIKYSEGTEYVAPVSYKELCMVDSLG